MTFVYLVAVALVVVVALVGVRLAGKERRRARRPAPLTLVPSLSPDEDLATRHVPRWRS